MCLNAHAEEAKMENPWGLEDSHTKQMSELQVLWTFKRISIKKIVIEGETWYEQLYIDHT